MTSWWALAAGCCALLASGCRGLAAYSTAYTTESRDLAADGHGGDRGSADLVARDGARDQPVLPSDASPWPDLSQPADVSPDLCGSGCLLNSTRCASQLTEKKCQVFNGCPSWAPETPCATKQACVVDHCVPVVCLPGASAGCGVGVCTGTKTCDADGQKWGNCLGGGGGPEVCNGLDDDCDTVVDNGACAPRQRCVDSGGWACRRCCGASCGGAACIYPETCQSDGLCHCATKVCAADEQCISVGGKPICTCKGLQCNPDPVTGADCGACTWSCVNGVCSSGGT